MNFVLWRDTALAAVVGGVGGSLAALSGLAFTLTGLGTKPLPSDANSFVIGTGIFFAIGAFLTFVSKEKDMKYALAIGMSLPGLIKAGTGEAPTGITLPAKDSLLTQFLPAAYAQTTAPATLSLEIPDPVGSYLWFINEAGVQTSIDLSGLGSEPTIAIPVGSVTFAFQGQAGWSDSVVLPTNGNATVSAWIDQRSAFNQGLRETLGAPSGFYEIELK